MNDINSSKSGKLPIILSIVSLFCACLFIFFVIYQQTEIERIKERIKERIWVTVWSKVKDSFVLRREWAGFDPGSSKGYRRINTMSGFFLIDLERVEPYLNGVRVHIKIGNLMFATFHGFKLKVKWQETLDFIDEREMKEEEISFTESLKAGHWNRIDFVLSPADPTKLGYLGLSIETDTVSLSKAFED